MELKSYQNRVLSDIEAYLEALMVSTGVLVIYSAFFLTRAVFGVEKLRHMRV